MVTRLLTVKEAAGILQEHPDSTRMRIRSGQIQGTKLSGTKNGRWRVSEEALERFLNRRPRSQPTWRWVNRKRYTPPTDDWRFSGIPSGILTASQVAERLNEPVRLTLRRINCGEIKGFKYSERAPWKVSEEELQHYLGKNAAELPSRKHSRGRAEGDSS
ncbi:helix-turn-helix domain-containing protein [Citricoccus sp.]|uniref:helix-turn-helix domain-containing protein n=1 Tax=Citricoccus sp. TaxID=1978372 RepID=UPI0037C120E4